MNINKKRSVARWVGVSVMALAGMVIMPSASMAQVKKEARAKMPAPPPPLPVIDKVPQFPGGPAKLAEYLKKSLRYPDEAKKKNVTGKVFVSFFIEEDGNVNEIGVVKGIGAGCDAEALRLIRDSPKWEPSVKNGKPVRAKVTLPITFALAGQKAPVPTPPKVKTLANGKKIYSMPEQMAEFPGGLQEFYKYLGSNMKYPKLARESNVQGKVFITFVIEDDGKITDAQVLKGIGAGCDEEALRVLLKGPKWTPGKQDGQAVAQQYTVPISFKLAKS